MHAFQFKMYIFSHLAINFTQYSPTVTWYMCDEFAAFTTFGTKAIYVLVFGRVVAIALSLNDLTIWVRLRRLFIMTNG